MRALNALLTVAGFAAVLSVFFSTNAGFQWCAPSAGARLPPQGNALLPLITSPALRLHAGCLRTTSAEMQAGEVPWPRPWPRPSRALKETNTARPHADPHRQRHGR